MNLKLRPILLILGILILLLAACSFSNPQSIPAEIPAPIPEEAQPVEEPDTEEPAPIGGEGTTALDAFLIPILDALTQSPPDYETIHSYMSDEFSIFMPFAFEKMSSIEAIEAFQSQHLPTSASITYDLDIDPKTRATFTLPKEMDISVYTTGWRDGDKMGVLLINNTEEGYEWVGIYLGEDKAHIQEPVRIEFEAGATGESVIGHIPPNGIAEYLLYALEGQTMTVKVTSLGDAVELSITGLSDGLPLLKADTGATSWTGVLPESQDYSIKLISSGAPIPSFQVEIEIPPLDQQSDVVWVPLPDGTCQDFEVTIAGELGTTDIDIEEPVPFEDYLEGTHGVGCLIQVGGTGADFSNPMDVFQQLKGIFFSMGWIHDPKYDGGGPTGILGAFRRDMGLVLVEVGWAPSEDADCPDDKPIGECDLTPEQKIYTIRLSGAMK